MKQTIFVPLTLLGLGLVAAYLLTLDSSVEAPLTSTGVASLETSGSNAPLTLSPASESGVDDRREKIPDLAQADVPWWEDKEFLLLAAEEYRLQLAEVDRGVEEYRQKTTGDASLRRSLYLGADLFETDAFPLTFDELQIDDQLKKVEMANYLNSIANWNRKAREVFYTNNPDQVKSYLSLMKRVPMEFPPGFLLRTLNGNKEVEPNPDFIADAKELYLRQLPRLHAAQREEGLGSSAAARTLLAMGLDNEEIGKSAAYFHLLGEDQIVPGKINVERTRQDFMVEFETLFHWYYPN
jgi:hypothetical protein